jgi:hypothetical protein
MGKALRVGHLLLRVQTEEIDFKNVFLQPDVHLHSRNTVVLLGRSCNSFMALRAAVLETLCDISRQTVDCNTAAPTQTQFNTAPASRSAGTSLKN